MVVHSFLGLWLCSRWLTSPSKCFSSWGMPKYFWTIKIVLTTSTNHQICLKHSCETCMWKPTQHQVITRYSISSFHGTPREPYYSPLQQNVAVLITQLPDSFFRNNLAMAGRFPVSIKEPKRWKVGNLLFLLPFQTVDVQVPCSFLRGCSWKLEIPW